MSEPHVPRRTKTRDRAGQVLGASEAARSGAARRASARWGWLVAALTLLALGCAGPQAPRGGAPGGAPPHAAPGNFQAPAGGPVVETFRPGAPRQRAHAYLHLPGASQRQLVNYDIVGDVAVMEGDILLGPASTLLFRYGLPWGANNDTKHALGTTNKAHLWPNAEMPYALDPSISAEKAAHIQWAVGEAAAAGIKLRPRGPADADHVVFRDRGDGCNSYVGRIRGAQPINISGCGRGSVLHEIMHAAGFHHEQSRGDRDQHVTIVWSEISEANRHIFEQRTGSMSDIGPYDYGSILHYSATAFSRSGKPTIVPRVPASIGQREGLSAGDRAGIKHLYGGGAAPAAPPPLGPQPPGPQPPGPQPPPPSAPPANAQTPFAGNYTSNHGEVSCTQSGPHVSCRSASVGLVCAASGTDLSCAWNGGGGQGRASFRRQPDGVLAGSWGDLFSVDSRGGWNLVPAAGAPPPAVGPATPPAPATQPANWPFGWPPPPLPFPLPSFGP